MFRPWGLAALALSVFFLGGGGGGVRALGRGKGLECLGLGS